jgi:small subunit ribosomal protein S17
MAAPQPASRRPRKTVIGVVVSDRMVKTITVAVETRALHPQVKKYVRQTTTYKAHDEGRQAHVGDTVRLAETRPLSKTKRWRLVEVLHRAEGAEQP